ncbi:DUF3006 domain-containing protein [Clostridium sp. CM028]|uniref:DUF3006 domain-containing protein n=1 Tax=Clostridium sp. CM028 TaxID=2851575 RepID=UPI001C6E2AF2|nr:DUF3006 domain-containing protein [Clostridium sp. CM028]MBW9150365.1 DUF3006 domain-containing protein [Clostridium sp. CM028]WLC63541.1 DUF3006 domain-containing protein [Clostridium sp. CM028]
MKIIIDRFEGPYAVCEKEDRTMMNIKKVNLPSQSKEGDVLSVDDNVITIDIKQTEKRRREIEKSTEDLWE